MRLLYISGLTRSGTTYISNFITQHLNVHSVGEIIKNIEIQKNPKEFKRYEEENRICTCGEHFSLCEFWAVPIAAIKQLDPYSSFDLILDRVDEKFGDTYTIDSSKNIDRLNRYYVRRGRTENLKVIYIVRNYAANCDSYVKYAQKWNKPFWKSNFTYFAYYFFYKHWQNLRYLKSSGLDYRVYFYEDLLFEGEKFVEDLVGFLGKDSRKTEGATREFHEIGGNEGFKRRGAKWFFDHRFINRKRNVVETILTLPVMLFNARLYQKYQL